LRSDTPPLAGALDELGADHRRRYETPVTVEVTGRARPLPPDAALARPCCPRVPGQRRQACATSAGPHPTRLQRRPDDAHDPQSHR
jgi:hypothetical protein